jgi:hypothetical protein
MTKNRRQIFTISDTSQENLFLIMDLKVLSSEIDPAEIRLIR